MKKIKIFCLSLCTILAISACTSKKNNSDVFIKINDNEVSKMEYLHYLRESVQSFELIGGEDIWETDFDGRTAQEVAKDNAFNSVVVVNLAVENADKYSAKLSENDESRAEIEAMKMAESVGEEKGSEFYNSALNVVRDKYLYNAVKQNLVGNINISKAQTESFCNENRQKYKENLIQAEYDIFYFDNYEKAENFKEIIKNGEVEENQYKEALSSTVGDLKERFNIDENISEGSIIGPYETAAGYIVIHIKKCNEADEKIIEETMKNDFENSVREEIFEKETSRWFNEADIQVNDEIWQTINIEDVK